jgi:serine protease Do
VAARSFLRSVLGGCVLLVALVAPPSPPASAATTDDLYEKFAPAVVQVRIENQASGSKAAIGSGFYVGDGSLVVTNYHVIAELVHHPGKYAAVVVVDEDTTVGLELRNIDVVHDLAVLGVAEPSAATLALTAEPPRKGTRLYSLGNPHDLGTSIVEGTYNGLLENSFYERMHFTGAINSGMSGGPVVDELGRVVGVNVATGGNALGFLVPAAYAVELVTATRADGYESPESFNSLLRSQLLANQEVLTRALVDDNFEALELGDFDVPGRPAPFFKCWGDEDTSEEVRFETVVHTCSTQDDIYIARGLSAGSVEIRHSWMHTDELNRFQFYSLLESRFAKSWSEPRDRDLVTSYACDAGFVEQGGADWKMVLCLRGYKKLEGLYDAVVLVASLAANDSALQTRVQMSGLSFENAGALARRFVESIRWRRR